MSSNVVAYLIVPTIAGGIALVPVAKEQLSVLFPQSSQPVKSTLTLPSNNSTMIGTEPSKSFRFAKQTCGDIKTGNETVWYPVFVDNANLDTIHRNYCADAISTVRKDTGNFSVQIASFSNRDRAVAFANQVGGEVGEPTFVNGGFQSESPISSNKSDTIESPVQSSSTQSASTSLPNLSSCAFDLSPNSNCGEQLSQFKQQTEQLIQETAQNSQPSNRLGSQDNRIRSTQTQIDVNNFLNNQQRSIDNQNFQIQQRNAAGCATTTSLVC